MSKLSDRQKTNIVAKWDTGEYTKTQLAKAYKVSDVMIGKIVGKKVPKNADIVKAQIYLEGVKKLEKSSIEIAEINKAVKNRLEEKYSTDNKKIKIYDMTNKVLDSLDAMLTKGKKSNYVKVNNYIDGKVDSQSLEVIELPLDTSDIKNIQDTVDKASITNNTNPRHSTTQTTINNANVQTNNSLEWELV